jgi:hypothetical protein
MTRESLDLLFDSSLSGSAGSGADRGQAAPGFPARTCPWRGRRSKSTFQLRRAPHSEWPQGMGTERITPERLPSRADRRRIPEPIRNIGRANDVDLVPGHDERRGPEDVRHAIQRPETLMHGHLEDRRAGVERAVDDRQAGGTPAPTRAAGAFATIQLAACAGRRGAGRGPGQGASPPDTRITPGLPAALSAR